MSEKEKKETLLFLGALLIILFVVICGVIVNLKKQGITQEQQNIPINQSQTDNINTLEEKSNSVSTNIKQTTSNLTGKYNVIPDKDLIYDEGLGRTLDDMSIELKSNNEFTIYDSWGISYYGNYTISENIVTLNTTRWVGESGITEGVTFTVNEHIKIKLKENNGILEIIEAPETIKVSRSDVEGAKEAVLNIKVGVKYSKKEIEVDITNDSKTNIIGEWKATKAVNEKGEEIALREIFGSGISYGNKLTFKDNMEYVNGIGITGEGNESGTYTIKENTITLTDLKQRIRNLTYNEKDNTLSEEGCLGDEIYTVTYIQN